jgi:succinate-acetate transporter protein
MAEIFGGATAPVAAIVERAHGNEFGDEDGSGSFWTSAASLGMPKSSDEMGTYIKNCGEVAKR